MITLDIIIIGVYTIFQTGNFVASCRKEEKETMPLATCISCGQAVAGEGSFCEQCQEGMVALRAGQKEDAVTAASLYIEQGRFFTPVVRCTFLFIALFLPLLGLLMGVLLSRSSFAGKEEFSEKMVRWSSVAFVVWLMIMAAVLLGVLLYTMW